MLPVKITGAVTHGKQIGRTFDIPTANIYPDIDVSDLAFGVYYSRVTVDGCTYRGITNLGVKPTVNDERRINVETFIYDFTGDLYGKTLEVELMEFRRPERKFDSVDDLFAEIRRDLEAGKTKTFVNT